MAKIEITETYCINWLVLEEQILTSMPSLKSTMLDTQKACLELQKLDNFSMSTKDNVHQKKHRSHYKNSTMQTLPIREWSLITGRGGLQNGRGGHVKFYPYEKGGRKKF